MPFPLGLSFQPGVNQGPSAGGGARSGTPSTPLQSAIKVLSLRMPSVVGARAPAPQLLLQGGGSQALGIGGATGDASIQLLRRLFETSHAQPPTQMPAPPPTQTADEPDAITGDRAMPAEWWRRLLSPPESFERYVRPDQINLGPPPPLFTFTGNEPGRDLAPPQEDTGTPDPSPPATGQRNQAFLDKYDYFNQ